MTTVLDEPADLLELVGQPVGTTEWIELTQQQVDLFAEAIGSHRWNHAHPQRVATSQFEATIAREYLTLSLTPRAIAQVLEIRELTTALNYGINKARFLAPVPVGSRIRATVTVVSAEQTTAGVESVFTLSYEIDGQRQPACVAEVVIVYP
jgi:acyl dehydratase